jgi:hypothetical protein
MEERERKKRVKGGGGGGERRNKFVLVRTSYEDRQAGVEEMLQNEGPRVGMKGEGGIIA